MSFDYDKLKKKHESGDQWASYSDLFMVLSVVFLLLYVVASLRTGTHTLQQQIKNQQLAERAQDLENQIKAYNNLKENYLEKSANEKEQEMYEQLMDKLTLLEEENREEASELRKRALENERKEMALNQYQQMIRNIINANVLSKSKIKRRDRTIASAKETIKTQVETIQLKDEEILQREQLIEQKESQIANLDQEVENKKKVIEQKDSIIALKQKVLKAKQQEISKLNKDINQKKKRIQINERKIAKINSNLNKQIQKLKNEQKKRKISKANYIKRMRALKKQSEREVAKLSQRNQSIKKKLVAVNTAVSKANKQLEFANKTIEKQQEQKRKLDQELSSAQSQKAKLDAELAKVQNQFAQTKAELEETKQAFQAEVARLEGQRSALEAQRNKLKGQKNLLKSQQEELKKINKQLAGVNSKLDAEKDQLTAVTKQLGEEKRKLAAEKDKLTGEKNQLSKDLKKAQEIINAKKKLAKKISDNFKRNGIEASVDPETGEVVLAFGDSYFDSGRARLKTDMRKTLNKFMPIYAESIFNDPKIAKKIKAVDIIGFASPTYQGRYVNPNSLDPKDRKAMEYNTNLSIERAKSVFKHIIDTRKLKFGKQKQITPLLKVSGRSYFSGALEGRAPAKEMSRKEFCQKYDCKKEQRVIIKFELDNK
ncbi:MAG: hypothetical protein CME66_07450 [Halobacteriovoraceae bacterium]|nr:hypothetical protein [Halobacteriovoraceae bacterium]